MTDWGMVALLIAAAVALVLFLQLRSDNRMSPEVAAYLRQAQELGWPGTAATPAGLLMMQTALDMIHRPVISDDDRTTQQAVSHVAAMWNVSEQLAQHYGFTRGPNHARIAMRLVASIRSFREKNYGATPTPEEWALCVAAPLASGKVKIEDVAKALELIDRAITAGPAPSFAARP